MATIDEVPWKGDPFALRIDPDEGGPFLAPPLLADEDGYVTGYVPLLADLGLGEVVVMPVFRGEAREMHRRMAQLSEDLVLPLGWYRYRACPACGGRASLHPTRHVEAKGRAACVDEGVADLIAVCWNAGIDTEESCQEHEPGRAFLSMHATDYERFLSRVLPLGEDDPFYGRMLWSPGEERPPTWDPPMLIPGTDDGAAPFSLSVGLVFPVEDIPQLVGRLRQPGWGG